MHAALDERGWLTLDAVNAMEREFAAEISDAFDFALASPVPTEADLYRYVYSD